MSKRSQLRSPPPSPSCWGALTELLSATQRTAGHPRFQRSRRGCLGDDEIHDILQLLPAGKSPTLPVGPIPANQGGLQQACDVLPVTLLLQRRTQEADQFGDECPGWHRARSLDIQEVTV